jgi:hypothetical protein
MHSLVRRSGSVPPKRRVSLSLNFLPDEQGAVSLVNITSPRQSEAADIVAHLGRHRGARSRGDGRTKRREALEHQGDGERDH